MARPLPALPMQKLPFLFIPTSYFLVIIAVLSVFSIVTFLCAGFHHNNFKPQRKREKQTVQLGEKKTISRLQSNISSKALLMVKMISWSKVRDDEEEEEMDGDEAVWKRKIMMGERHSSKFTPPRLISSSIDNDPIKTVTTFYLN
ncbi:hypothetical protein RHGRI_028881 [Rhododendron griersonianum]|uniref:Transmembrane protein n=1 Tax=Rhododendron griersonianum TaxID=479676 RepID=A0AAV6IKU8_9ERIC|nr:hypothetical protein RHGRI_028881 [Rhododendron griersonianum]